MTDEYMLKTGQWTGWLQHPVGRLGTGGTFARIVSVSPKGTGRSILEIEAIFPLDPPAMRHRTVTARIVHHGHDHLVVVLSAPDTGTAIVSNVDEVWLRVHAAALLGLRPYQTPRSLLAEGFTDAPTPDGYLNELFGDGFDENAHGVTAAGWDLLKHMPDEFSSVRLERRYDALRSSLVARGFRPHSMDDRWHIHMDGDIIALARSWSGFRTHNINARWHGDELELVSVDVNRNASQYKAEGDADEAARAVEIIEDIILGGSSAE